MVYAKATDSPPRYQFEASSAPSQSNNCGPTCVTKIAQYYRDTYYGIESTRRTIAGMGPYYVNGRWFWGAPTYYPTTATQQRDMLARRGVPSTIIRIDSLYQMRKIVAGGRRPIIIGVYMARVPWVYRDHPFMGWHALVVMDTAYVGGQSGFWVMDPNFSPPGGRRTDPDRGRKFYPDWVMQHAYINNNSRVRAAIVPNRAKIIQAPVPVQEGLPVKFKSPSVPSWVRLRPKAEVRTAPNFNASVLVTIGSNGAGPYPLVGYTRGTRYRTGRTSTSNVWALYRMNSRTTDPYDGRFAYVPNNYVEVRSA